MNRDVIIACDFKDKEETFNFLSKFKGETPFLKIGMELFYREGAPLVRELKARGHKIFLDLKLHDIPTTVEKAMRNLASLNVDMTNVHAAGGIKMMQGAMNALGGTSTLLIAVTQLTSTNSDTLKNEILIDMPLDEVVKTYAKNAKAAGLHGIVCSPLEAPIAKELNLISVTPGIRLEGDDTNDQKRVATPSYAKEAGSTFIVVGRSITQAADPLLAYRRCVDEFC